MNKFSPGGDCICCSPAPPDPCLLLDDDFGRADNTDPGTDWVEETGGCEISSGTMKIGTGTSQIIATTGNPDNSNTTITVDFMLSGVSTTARIFLGWSSTSAYLYATISKTSLTVGEAGGSSASDTHSLTTGVWYTAELCFLDGLLVGRVVGQSEAAVSGLTAPGNRHGVGCGPITAYFDNFVAKKVADDCEECVFTETIPCGQCETGQIPRFWRVDISGVTNGTGPGACTTGCSDINGTYIIDISVTCSHGTDESTGHASCGGEVEGPELTGCPGAPFGVDGKVWIQLHPAWFISTPPYDRDTIFIIEQPFSGGGYTPVCFTKYNWGTALLFGSPTPVIPCEDTDMVGLTLDTPVDDTSCDFTGATITITPLV